MTAAVSPAFTPVRCCWVCEGTALPQVHELAFDLSIYRTQDPELAEYTGSRIGLCRCVRCGFAQPAALPGLPRFFDRLYDQRWSEAWIRAEFDAPYKDLIFSRLLADLERRVPSGRRRLLDVGAHAGRFVALARARGWHVEGLELNPQTAEYAARRSGARIRQLNVHDVRVDTAAFDAVTLTDVLEHIPDPVRVLSRVRELLAPGGWLGVKVPCGPAQLLKERWRARLVPGYRATVADNLVHVSHFSPASLRRALDRAGLVDIEIAPGAPELADAPGIRGRLSRAARLWLYHAARLLPWGIHTPLALNLQAYARRPEP